MAVAGSELGGDGRDKARQAHHATISTNQHTIVLRQLQDGINDDQDENGAQANLFFDLDLLLCSLNLDFLVGCVCNEAGLRQKVSDAGNDPNAPTQIALCRNSRVEVGSVLDVSDKTIQITCNSFFLAFLTWLFPSTCSLDGAGATRLIRGTNAWLSLEDLNVVNGNVPSTETIRDGGAILMLQESTLLVDSCSFSANEASQGAGGAVSVRGGVVEIARTEFRNNGANDGGALAVNGASVRIDECVFIDNQATAGGAAILNGGTTFVEDTMFFDNRARSRVSSVVSRCPSN